jgi:hypothetical protein
MWCAGTWPPAETAVETSRRRINERAAPRSRRSGRCRYRRRATLRPCRRGPATRSAGSVRTASRPRNNRKHPNSVCGANEQLSHGYAVDSHHHACRGQHSNHPADAPIQHGRGQGDIKEPSNTVLLRLLAITASAASLPDGCLSRRRRRCRSPGPSAPATPAPAGRPPRHQPPTLATRTPHTRHHRCA